MAWTRTVVGAVAGTHDETYEMAVTTGGDLFVVGDYVGQSATCIVRASDVWSVETVEDIGAGDLTFHQAIAVDSSDGVHCAYTYRVTDGGVTSWLAYAKRSGVNTWVPEQVVEIATVEGDNGDECGYASVAIATDSDDYPHILYFSDKSHIKHAWYDGTWHTEAVDTLSGDLGGGRIGIAVGAGDVVYAAWFDPDGSVRRGVKSGTWTCADLNPATSEAPVGVGGAAVRVGADDVPHIVYMAQTGSHTVCDKLGHAWYDGGWQDESAATSAYGFVWGPNLAVDADGHLHVFVVEEVGSEVYDWRYWTNGGGSWARTTFLSNPPWPDCACIGASGSDPLAVYTQGTVLHLAIWASGSGDPEDFELSESYVWHLTVDGFDYYPWLLRETLTVNQVEGSETGTLTAMLSDHDEFIELGAKLWTKVYMYEDGGYYLFGGYLVKASPGYSKSGEYADWTIKAESWNGELARSPVITGTWKNRTPGEIINDIVCYGGPG